MTWRSRLDSTSSQNVIHQALPNPKSPGAPFIARLCAMSGFRSAEGRSEVRRTKRLIYLLLPGRPHIVQAIDKRLPIFGTAFRA